MMSQFSAQPPIVQQPMRSNIASSHHHSSRLYDLETSDCLMIKQKKEALEIACGCETNNRYVLRNKKGEDVFYAFEDTDSCSRECCRENRNFTINITDRDRRMLIQIKRDREFNCCCPAHQTLEVYSPSNHLLGTVERINLFSLAPEFDVKNESGERVLKITGPAFTSGAADFDIYSRDGSVKVGRISKQWRGFLTELFTDADTFGVSFPIDMDVKIKAILLGAVFLIDFMYYEH